MNLKAFYNNKQFLSLSGNVVMAALNIITTAILYRHMGKDEVGSWFFFQVVFAFIDTFRTGFLQTAFIKFYAGADKQRAENILGSTWYLALLITLIVFFISVPCFFLTRFIHNISITAVINWIGITFIATLPIVIATWVLQARQCFKKILYIRLINQLSFVIMVLICIYLHNITLNLVLVTNLVSCLLTCAVIFILRWEGIKTLRAYSLTSVKELFNFGKFSVGTSIGANLLRSSDVFIINFALGPASVAVYSIAQSLMNIIDIPLRSFVVTGMTSLSAAQNKNNMPAVETIFKKYAGVLTLVFIPVAIGAIFFADVAVGLIGGGKYMGSEAANIFRIFMTFGIFFSIDKFTGVTLDVIHQPKYNFYKVLLMLIINVVGDFTGLYFLHNLYGIALASIPTFIIGTVFGYLVLQQHLTFNLRDILRSGYFEITALVNAVGRKISFQN